MPASKFWKPPMPARCIHWRSLRMPSLLTLPFIQCHQTRGFAAGGGVRNCRSKGLSVFVWAWLLQVKDTSTRSAVTFLAKLFMCVTHLMIYERFKVIKSTRAGDSPESQEWKERGKNGRLV